MLLMWIGFSTFLVNYMGFAIKNNSAISLGLGEASQRTMGSDDISQLSFQNKNNRLLGVQGRYAPQGIDRDKGKICWVVMLICILIGLNVKCVESRAGFGLVWTLEEMNFRIHKKNLPNRISETREFYICTNMYPFNRMRDKLGIMYTQIKMIIINAV